MRKLTLSMEESVIEDARRLAKEQGTSISGMFSRLVRAMARRDQSREVEDLPPRTRAALGIIKAPEGKTDRELIEEALIEKYGPFE